MTIGANYQPVKQAANGITTSFGFDFKLLRAEYLNVFYELNQVRRMVEDSEYDLIFNDNGGTVNFHTAPENGAFVIIGRSVTIDQETPYKTSSGFQAERIEENLDKLTAITQQQNDSLNRSPKLPLGVKADLTLPQPNPGKGIIWNADGSGFRNSQTNIDEIEQTTLGARDTAIKKAAEAAASAGQSGISALDAAAALVSCQALADRAEHAAGSVEAQAQSLYQEAVILETAEIILEDKKCRYYCAITADSRLTVNAANCTQTDKEMIFELVLIMPEVFGIDLTAVTTVWLGGEAPELSEPGEHWFSFISRDGGTTWRGSYEGIFPL